MTGNKEKLEIEQRIDRYVNGELSGEEVDELWVKLIEREEYMDYLETSANLKKVVEDEKAQSVRYQRVWMYAAAAVIILLLVVMSSMRLGYFDTSTSIKPIQTIELNYNRSAEAVTDLSSRQQVIRKAIKLYNEGKFDKAVDFLSNERDKAQGLDWITELDITLGTIYYDMDKFNDAAYYFTDVTQYKGQIKKLKLEKAYWYLGNSYFQMSMLKEAGSAMTKAYKLNGAYSRVAKSYLDAMANATTEQLNS